MKWNFKTLVQKSLLQSLTSANRGRSERRVRTESVMYVKRAVSDSPSLRVASISDIAINLSTISDFFEAPVRRTLRCLAMLFNSATLNAKSDLFKSAISSAEFADPFASPCVRTERASGRPNGFIGCTGPSETILAASLAVLRQPRTLRVSEILFPSKCSSKWVTKLNVVFGTVKNIENENLWRAVLPTSKSRVTCFHSKNPKMAYPGRGLHPLA